MDKNWDIIKFSYNWLGNVSKLQEKNVNTWHNRIRKPHVKKKFGQKFNLAYS